MLLSESEIRQHVVKILTTKGWNFALEVKVNSKHLRTIGRADIVLYFQSHQPVAVIECKRSTSLNEAIEQAQGYADSLGVIYCFATNGQDLYFREQVNGLRLDSKLNLNEFPDRNLLWQLYCSYYKYDLRHQRLLTQTNYQLDGVEPRQHQLEAINQTTTAIVKGQKRLLLVMAQGTGVTYVHQQIVWRLTQSQFVKRALILVDQNNLLFQTSEFYREAFSDSVCIIQNQQIKAGYAVYVSTYQNLTAIKSTERAYQQVSNDYFDVIIVNDCHRGVGKETAWQHILSYFNSAIQIGITPTPNFTTAEYFDNPVFEYDWQQSTEDGYTLKARLIQIDLPADSKIHDEFTEQLDTNFSLISIKRMQAVAQEITTYLQTHDPMAKTIIFCSNVEHAQYMQQCLAKLNQEQMAKDNRYVVKLTAEDNAELSILDSFIDPDSPYPVIATTVNKLATGVDIPTCKLIVIDREVQSSSLLLQMISRGTRIANDYDKNEFTILDFSDSTKRFEQQLKGIIKETKIVDSIAQLNPATKNQQSFNEAKVIVFGDNAVGKTTLIHQLESEALSKSTQGINLADRNPIFIGNYKLNMFEFGDRRNYGDISKLLFTTNSLYLYVINNQTAKTNNIDHWLNLIKTKVGDAPIVIIFNKINSTEVLEFNINEISEKYNVVDTLEISLADNNKEPLKDAIVRNLATLPTIKTSFANSWHNIKKELFERNTHTSITPVNFEQICKNNNVNDLQEMRELLDALNNLGNVVFHQPNNALKDVKIIEPHWVIDWLYSVAKLKTSTNGEIELEQLIKANKQPELEDIHWFIDFLSEYELVFKLTDNKLLFPWALSTLPNDFDITTYQQGINYRFNYQLIAPTNIIGSLAVALQTYINLDKSNVFQQAVFLTLKDAAAAITVDNQNGNIDIAVNKSSQNAKILLAHIVKNIRDINQSSTQVTEQIALTHYTSNQSKVKQTETTSKLMVLSTLNLPAQLLKDFEQWEYNFWLRIYQALAKKPMITTQQQLPDLKRELIAFKIPLTEFIANSTDAALTNSDRASSNIQLTRSNLQHLCDRHSLCTTFINGFAQMPDNRETFIRQFNQIINHYELPQSYLINQT